MEREAELGPWGTEAPDAPGTGRGRPSTPDPFRILLGAMAAAARARSMRTERSDVEDWEPTPRRRGGGCIGKLVMLLLILVTLFLLLPVLLGALLGLG